jgi:hypothetical protein
MRLFCHARGDLPAFAVRPCPDAGMQDDPRGQRQTGLLRQGCTRGIGRQIGCGKTRDDSRGRPAKPGAEKYVDTIGAEDARMSAQLKNICRGC